MKELAGGEISSDITDIYPTPVEDFKFDISFARIDSLIGTVSYTHLDVYKRQVRR